MSIPKIQIFNYAVKNKSDDTLDVYVDGEIVDAPTQQILKDWFGDETSTSYKSFRNSIEQASPKVLNVYVNSPGGYVGDAMAIHDYLNDLERKGVTVNRIGRGIIASAGTYILMGNNSEMSKNSILMIHNISMVAAGSINEVENQVKAGRKFNDLIRDFYVDYTGNPPETISLWMNKETHMNAEEARDRGFVKKVTKDVAFTNAIPQEKWPFINTAILNTYNSFTKDNSNMDVKAITDHLNGLFNSFYEKLVNKKDDEAAIKDAFREFSEGITNAIKENQQTPESIQAMVNASIQDATKDFPTTEKVINSITEATKGIVTVDVLKNELGEFKDGLIKSIGNKVIKQTEGNGEVKKNKRVPNKIANNKYYTTYEPFGG
jgi:ATP-dependent Clp protease protease subunit